MAVLLRNRKVLHDYEILETYEMGIKLFGHEVKAIKEGKGRLTGTYVKPNKNDFWLLGFNLPMYSKAGAQFEYDPVRSRKLLVHKYEFDRLNTKVERQGYTLVPLKFYTKGQIIKLAVGLAKGKKKEDKKRAKIELQQKRELDKLLKEANR